MTKKSAAPQVDIEELKRDLLSRGFLTRQMAISEARPEEILERVQELANRRRHTLSISESQAVIEALCKK